MTAPTDYEIARAQRAGRAFARAGKPLTDCPFNANGDGPQRVLAMRFTRAYLGERPTEGVDYDDDPDDEEPEPGEATRAALDGDQLQAYWTRGKGLARWSTNPHPWTRLLGLLRKHPGIRDPEGLASHYFKAVFGIWPGERKGSNAAGPG